VKNPIAEAERFIFQKVNSRMKAGGSLLFMFELLCFLPLATLADQDVQARFETSLKNARSFTNVEMQMIDTLWLKSVVVSKDPKSAMPGFTRTFQYSCIASGEKYRGERRLISASVTNIAQLVEAAFDGTTYFSYDADVRYMTRKTGNSDGDNVEDPSNPLLAPFLFLTRQTDGCINCILRFSDVLSPAFTRGLALPQGRNRSDGLLEVDMPGLPLMKQPTLWHILLDSKGDSFAPKQIRSVGPGAETVYELLDYTNLQAYQFPSVITWRSATYPATVPATVIATGMVTMISVRIPEQIPDSTFQLDEKSAATVWDWDQKTFAKESPRLVTLTANRSNARILMLTIILLTILFVCIGIRKSFVSKRN